MDEVFEIEQPIGVYVRLDKDNNVLEINSERFITNKTEWYFVDEGFGDKYAHAQSQYLDKPLIDECGDYNYKYVNGTVIEIFDDDKQKKRQFTYAELVEQKIRTRYTISDELALLRQRETKIAEFAEYNGFCEKCKAEAREEVTL